MWDKGERICDGGEVRRGRRKCDRGRIGKGERRIGEWEEGIGGLGAERRKYTCKELGGREREQVHVCLTLELARGEHICKTKNTHNPTILRHIHAMVHHIDMNC